MLLLNLFFPFLLTPCFVVTFVSFTLVVSCFFLSHHLLPCCKVHPSCFCVFLLHQRFCLLFHHSVTLLVFVCSRYQRLLCGYFLLFSRCSLLTSCFFLLVSFCFFLFSWLITIRVTSLDVRVARLMPCCLGMWTYDQYLLITTARVLFQHFRDPPHQLPAFFVARKRQFEVVIQCSSRDRMLELKQQICT